MEDELVEPLVTAVEGVVGDLNEPGTGVAFAVPVDFVKGIAKPLS